MFEVRVIRYCEVWGIFEGIYDRCKFLGRFGKAEECGVLERGVEGCFAFGVCLEGGFGGRRVDVCERGLESGVNRIVTFCFLERIVDFF